MTRAPAVAEALAALARTFDALHEADVRANPGGLLANDRPRAVAAIDTALDATLDGFHALCLATDAQLPDVPVDWYADDDVALVLGLRAARLRGDAHRPRTIYAAHAQHAARPTALEHYVLVDFDYAVERADAFDVFLSWSDFDACLGHDGTAQDLHPATIARIRSYLGADDFPHYAAHHALPVERVFFNVVPLFVNAGATIATLIAPVVETDAQAQALLGHRFAATARADTRRPQVLSGPFLLPA